MSDFVFTQEEAVSGINDSYLFPGRINVTVASGSARYNRWGGYTPDAQFTVPEPGSLALLGFGLIAAFGMTRRLKRSV